MPEQKLTEDEEKEMRAGRAQTLEMVKRLQSQGGSLNHPTVDDIDADNDQRVTMIIPQPFLLTLRDRRQVRFPAGIHEVPIAINGENIAGDGSADKDKGAHWYVRAHKCEIYKPRAAKAVPDADAGKDDDKGGKGGKK